MIKSYHFSFLISIFGGVFVWMFIFLLFPADVVFPFSKETFWFIFLSYSCLLFGYVFAHNFLKKRNSDKNSSPINEKFIYIIILITLFSFIIRYIDFFFFRKISFYNDVFKNRELLAKNKPNLLFIIVSVLKQLYFIPIIFLLKNKIKNKKINIISLLLFLLPFLEGFIRGSRNSFFTPVILLFIILIFFKKILFNRKQILLIISVVFILFTIATSIIMQREESKTDKNYSSLTTNFFLNDFLKPKSSVFKKIHSTKSLTLKKMMVSGFQIAQYYVHGVFEFDNLVRHYQKEPINHQYGKFNFSIVNRFTNKYRITNTNLEDVQYMNPRGITFVTFFGGLYIDFGWLGLIVMFLYGSFQRFIVNSIHINNNSSYLPFLIFFLFCNFFMLTFNFIRNTGTYTIVVCLIVIFAVTLHSKFCFKNKAI